MRSPYAIYFAGVGTVVAALAVGFGGGLALTTTSVLKEKPAVTVAREERLRIIGKPEVSRIEAATADAAPVVAFAPAPPAPAGTNSSSSGTLMAITAQAQLAVQPVSVMQPVAAQDARPRNTATPEPAVAQKADVAEKRKPDRKRQLAERKRDNSYSRRWITDDNDAGDPTRAGTRTAVVRTYESRSNGFGGLFASDDD